MTTIVLALVAPVVIGFSDHIGAGLSRRGRPMALVLWIYVASIPFTAGAAALIGGTPNRADIGFGLMAGFFGASALMALYKGYSMSGVAVVAPVAAVTGAVVPIGAALVISALPSATVQGGLIVGLGAVWLVGFDRSGAPLDTAALRYGTMAGVLFGTTSVLLGLTQETAGIWPLLAARAVSVILIFSLLRIRHLTTGADPGWSRPLALIGLAAAVGTGAFILAAQRNLAVAGLFMQMAYGFTLLFQILLAGERATKAQVAGFGLAIIALSMISLG